MGVCCLWKEVMTPEARSALARETAERIANSPLGGDIFDTVLSALRRVGEAQEAEIARLKAELALARDLLDKMSEIAEGWNALRRLRDSEA
jgi:GAF domain-containing protein